MRLLTFIVFVGLLLLSSCDKVKQNAKKLDGTWTIYSYSEITAGGFKTNYEASGSITFTTQKDGTFQYEEDFTIQKDSGPFSFERKGNGSLFGEKGKNYELHIVSPTTDHYTESEISLITKDDLKIKQRETGVERIIVLQKN